MNKLIDILEDNEDVQNVWAQLAAGLRKSPARKRPLHEKAGGAQLQFGAACFCAFSHIFCVFHTGKG